MTIQLGNPDAMNHQSTPTNVFLLDQNFAYPVPSAKSSGVSFPPNVTRFVMVTTVAVFGTCPTLTTMEPLQNVAFVFPALSHATPTETTLERYEKRRKEIVASGIPLLSDEELREEIRDRKGVREP
jgi:hypothetical protein